MDLTHGQGHENIKGLTTANIRVEAASADTDREKPKDNGLWYAGWLEGMQGSLLPLAKLFICPDMIF